MGAPTIEFWFEYGSTYTYLSVARIGELADAAGVDISWRPFLLLPLMKSFGMEQGPFLPFAAKHRYMWRDLERRAERHGLPYRRPSHYPPNTLLTARIGMLAARQGWCREFTEKTFHLHWVEDKQIGTETNLLETIAALGRDPEAVFEASQHEENKNALRVATESAQSIGIFGSPSFIVDGELFWGDDRLGEAFEWALVHHR